MLLGQAVSRIEEEVRFEFQSAPEGALALLGAVGLAGVAVAIVLMYRSEGRAGASPRRRFFLAGLRVTVMLLLAAVLLEPVLAKYLHRWIDSYTIVLVDTSASMSLGDRYRDADAEARVRRALPDAAADLSETRRIDVVSALLARDRRAFLRALTERNRVRVYAFAEDCALTAVLRAAREAGGGGSEKDVVDLDGATLAFSADGAATDIERAVRQAVEAQGEAPLAGVVVFSDGGFNRGGGVEGVARFLRERRVPLMTVGIGDPAPPRNLRITTLEAPEFVFPDDPFQISVSLASEGLAGSSARVTVYEQIDGQPGPGRVIDRRDLAIDGDGPLSPVSFEHRQPAAGMYTYVVAADAGGDESVVDDNRRSATVRVADSRVSVLLVSGAPSWEYQNLVRLLQRDASFELACWLQSADARAVRDGDTILRHLPVLAEELFVYDVVVLLDPSADGLDEGWAGLLDRFVTEHGGGLIFIAGRQNAPSLLRDERIKPVVDLLPVSMNPDADLILNRLGFYQRREYAVAVETEALTHPVIRAPEGEAATRLMWEGRGGVYWHYPVLRAKPVASVLLRHTDPAMRNQYGAHILAAVQYAGAGRTGFLAFDSTWRWRQGAAENFNRFWIQMLRHLSEGKLFRGGQRGVLSTPGSEFPVGEAVQVEARLFNEQFEPLALESVEVQVQGPTDQQALTLMRRVDRPGEYAGRFAPSEVGAFTLTLGPWEPSQAEPLVREVRIVRPSLELVRPQMDRTQMSSLAAVSEGGRYFECDELMNIPPLIPDRHEVTTTKSRPTSLWDRAWTLAALVILLGVEWGVRKWSRML